MMVCGMYNSNDFMISHCSQTYIVRTVASFMRERERQRQRQRDRDRDRQTDRQRQRCTHKETETERYTQRDREIDRQTDRQRQSVTVGSVCRRSERPTVSSSLRRTVY